MPVGMRLKEYGKLKAVTSVNKGNWTLSEHYIETKHSKVMIINNRYS